MQIKASTPDEYIQLVEETKQEALSKLREVINANIPKDFEECIAYGMLAWVVPHSLYPAGYHCSPQLPLPFANVAAQKNFISIYHMCLYANDELKEWFVGEHQKVSPKKLDMGKSCIRYKKAEDIPFDLIGELFTKITPEQWINQYTKSFLGHKKT